MTTGVYCEPYKKRVTFDECALCAQCLPTSIIKSLRIYDYTPQRNTYYVKEMIGCLRKAYFARKSAPADTYLTLKSLYAIKRGKIFGNMVDGSRWIELDGSIALNVDGEYVKLSARLDSYDPQRGAITELKSLEGVHYKNLPRRNDVLQLQSYGTIFKSIIPVRQLTLVYLDMNSFKQFDVEQLDLTSWLKGRVEALHRALRDSKPPGEEPSYECKFCDHKKNCSLVPIINSVTRKKPSSTEAQ